MTQLLDTQLDGTAETKLCTTCNVVSPKASFDRGGKFPNSKCLQCRREYAKQWKEAGPKQKADKNATRRLCKSCGIEKDSHKFLLYKVDGREYRSVRCATCEKLKARLRDKKSSGTIPADNTDVAVCQTCDEIKLLRDMSEAVACVCRLCNGEGHPPRTCQKCGECKPFEAFKTPHKQYCRLCIRALSTIRAEKSITRRLLLLDTDSLRIAEPKTCRKCGQTKLLSEFGMYRGLPKTWCKCCINAQRHQYDAPKREAAKLERQRAKEEQEAWKEANAEALETIRLEKARVQRAKWKANNLEKWRLMRNKEARKYRKARPLLAKTKNHNRRANLLRAGGTFKAADVQNMLASQEGRCAAEWCRVDISAGYHIDHVMPLILGGSNWPENLQLLCPKCNLTKNAKHPEVWKSENMAKHCLDRGNAYEV